MFIIFSDFVMFKKIFFSPQVEQGPIISNNLVYTSCFTSCQTTQDLGNIRKISKLYRIIAQCLVRFHKTFGQYQQKYPKKQKLTYSHSALFHMKFRVCLNYFVNDCLWKQFLASNSPQTHSSLIFWTIFVTLRHLTKF